MDRQQKYAILSPWNSTVALLKTSLSTFDQDSITLCCSFTVTPTPFCCCYLDVAFRCFCCLNESNVSNVMATGFRRPSVSLGSLQGNLMFHVVHASVFQGKDFCFGLNNEQYRCEMGYCCGETECCTYYYELWCKLQGLLFCPHSI